MLCNFFFIVQRLLKSETMPRKWYQPCMEECYERKSYLPFDFFGRFPFGWMDNWYEHWGWITREHAQRPQRDRPSYVVNTLTDTHNELRELEPGQIVFDERRQKWYRVKKTMIPSHLTTGPMGIGDPDDRFLRRIEKDTLIPELMAKRIEKVECRPEFMEYITCLREKGEYAGNPRCKPLLKKFQKCKVIKFRDPAFMEQMTNEFLEGRAEMRRTRLNDQQQEVKRYFEDRIKELEQQLKEIDEEKNCRPRHTRD